MASKGMRFWIPSRMHRVGCSDWLDDDPFKGQVQRCRFARLIYKGRELEIVGEAYIEDENIAKELMRSPGILRFDAKEFDIVFKGANPPAPVTQTGELIPDFDALNRRELCDWLGDHQIKFDARWNKERLLEACREAAKGL